MPDEFTFEPRGLTEVEAKLARLIALVEDLRPFWPFVVPLFVGWEAEQFASEGAFWGEGWPELTADYAAWKSEHYPSKGLLVAEGELKRAAQTPGRVATPTSLLLTIEPFTKQKGPGAGRTIEPSWFQDGTASMPARPLVPDEGQVFATKADTELSRAAEAYVQEMIRRLGL